MHTIVYLDQNYLSNMAKAQVGLIKDETQAEFWYSLFDDLKKAVLADKIACPQHEFHATEAMYDRRLEEPIRQVIEELSWGLRFCHWQDILESQIEDAAKNFLGKQIEEREPWVIAFESDPQAPIESRMHDILGTKGRINVHFSLPDEVIEHDRQQKLKFVDGVQELLSTHINSHPDDLQKAIIQEKKSFLDGFMGIQALRSIGKQSQEDSAWSQLNALCNLKNLVNLLNRLHGIGINPNNAKSFGASEELLNAPFIDIFATIYAVISTYYPRRKTQAGDYYDMAILGTALPYCDVITTDKFLKEILVNILHFDDKYKAKIFSASEEDRLALQELVRGLPISTGQ